MEELIKALSQALIKAGLTEDSEQFKQAVNPVNFEGLKLQLETKLPTTFDEALKLPGFQSTFDKKITNAIQTNETNLKEKYDFFDKGKAPQAETPEAKRMRELEERLNASDLEKANLLKRASAENLLNEKKIPKQLLRLFDFNSEIELAEQANQIESTFTEIKQNIITQGIGSKLPFGTGNDGKVSDKDADDIVSRM